MEFILNIQTYFAIETVELCCQVDQIQQILQFQLDESAIHRRKFNRGRRKPLIWIWTAVERKPGGGNSGLYIIKVVKNGTAVNLLRIIKDTIAPGTTLINDQWASYRGIAGLEGYNFTHLDVNHQLIYVDPITGACTNAIESSCHLLRKFFPEHGFPT
ncbi:MAG: hypothetical protein EZS28_012457 [Streblomastix strix]|uniref:ISXO2-like transposase domain-containing protein n=1 Tax=Streblomastix strix TaxID=222440 RepID=A0A5J4WAM1_9EUKA|nr:MAG: hypothetical protein EZS28_012457 [Streblomastix strix]